jgi:hypothetical protein
MPSTSYGISRSIGTSSYGSYNHSLITGPLNTNKYPGARTPNNLGTLQGLRPTPPQFVTPIYSDQGTIPRSQYLRATAISAEQKARKDALGKESAPISYHNVSNNRKYAISSHVNYTAPIPSSMRTSIAKSIAVGKSAYKVGLPLEAPISTKSYYPSGTRSSLRRVRSGGSVAPAKKGSIYNTHLNSAPYAWGALPRTTY